LGMMKIITMILEIQRKGGAHPANALGGCHVSEDGSELRSYSIRRIMDNLFPD